MYPKPGVSITTGLEPFNPNNTFSYIKNTLSNRVQPKVYYKVFVNNLPPRFPRQLLQKLFKTMGNIVQIKRLDLKDKPANFAYIMFDYFQSIYKCQFYLHKLIIGQCQLNVTIPKEGISRQPPIIRQQSQVRQKLRNVINSIQYEYRKFIQQKLKQDYEKEHPRQKQRQLKKKQNKKNLQKLFKQKLQKWQRLQEQHSHKTKKQQDRQRERNQKRQKYFKKQNYLSSSEEEYRNSKLKNQKKQLRNQYLAQYVNYLSQNMINPPEPQGQAVKVFIQTQQVPLPQSIQSGGQPNVAKFINLQQKKVKCKVQKQCIAKQTENQQILNRIKRQQQQKNEKQQNNKLLHQKKIEQYISLYNKVPQDRQVLFQYNINWNQMAKRGILQKKIRPWLFKKCNQFVGANQQYLVKKIEKKLVNKIDPKTMILKLQRVLQQDTQKFVIKLWKQLVFQEIKFQLMESQ